MSVRVAILTGAGSAFSSGGNVKKMADGGGLGGGLPAQTRRNYKLGIQRIPLAFDRLDVPIIAAVNGPAIGAGLRPRLHVRRAHRRREREVRRELRQAGHRSGRRRRVAAAARGRLFEGLRDGLHRRHAERRRGARLRPGVEGRAGCRTAGRGAQAGRAHRRQPAARGAHDQAADPRRPARPARHAAGAVRRHAVARPRHRRPQGGGGGVPREAQAGVRRRREVCLRSAGRSGVRDNHEQRQEWTSCETRIRRVAAACGRRRIRAAVPEPQHHHAGALRGGRSDRYRGARDRPGDGQAARPDRHRREPAQRRRHPRARRRSRTPSPTATPS